MNMYMEEFHNIISFQKHNQQSIDRKEKNASFTNSKEALNMACPFGAKESLMMMQECKTSLPTYNSTLKFIVFRKFSGITCDL